MDITALYKTKTTAAELLTDMQAFSGVFHRDFNLVCLLLASKKTSISPPPSFRLISK